MDKKALIINMSLKMSKEYEDRNTLLLIDIQKENFCDIKYTTMLPHISSSLDSTHKYEESKLIRLYI